METLMVFWLYIRIVVGNLNAIQFDLWKFDQYAYVTPDFHSFPGTFAHIWFNWNLVFVMFSLNCHFNWNLSMKFLFFIFLLSHCLLKCQH